MLCGCTWISWGQIYGPYFQCFLGLRHEISFPALSLTWSHRQGDASCSLLQMGNKNKTCSFENQSELYIQFSSGHFSATCPLFSVTCLFPPRKYKGVVPKPAQRWECRSAAVDVSETTWYGECRTSSCYNVRPFNFYWCLWFTFVNCQHLAKLLSDL